MLEGFIVLYFRVIAENEALFLTVFSILVVSDIVLILRRIRSKKSLIRDLPSRLIGNNFFIAYAVYVIALQKREFLTYTAETPIVLPLVRGLVAFTFLILGASYLIRKEVRVSARGFGERLFPFFCAILPIAVNEAETVRWALWVQSHHSLAALFTPWGVFPSAPWGPLTTISLLFGNILIVWSLISLRHSFSIMAEVREIVSSGPYRFVRHPIYLGQFFSTIGCCLLAPSWANSFLLVIFFIAQTTRARFEEKKLVSASPTYREYQKRTGFFLPGL